MPLKYVRQLTDNNRVEVVEAIQLAHDRYLIGETYTAINIPPRYGKSAIIRLIALEINAITGAPVVMTAPWSDNVDQIKDKSKGEETFKRYGVPLTMPFPTHRVAALPTNQWWRHSTGVPTLLTCTMGLIQNKANQQQFIDGLTDIRDRFNCRPVLLIDECHLIKQLQEWGQFIERAVREADAYVVVLTGTAVPGIPGFAYDFEGWKDFVRRIPRRRVEDGKIKYVLEEYEGQSRKVASMRGHINVEWKHAWDIGALARVNAVWVDTTVIDGETNQNLGKLSELEPKDLNGRIKQIMESPELMREMARRGLRRLHQKRRRDPAAQAIVFTGADELDPAADTPVHDVHANQFKFLIDEEAKTIGMKLRVEIATGNVTDAEKLIKAFRNGEIDVLIVKMMGAVGLDVELCKVLMWGSRMRNGPLAIQALSRVLTAHGNMRADMIMPMDCRMVEFYKRVVSDQGGDYREVESQLVGEEEYEPEQRHDWRMEDASISAYGDEMGALLSGDFEEVLQIIKHKYDTSGLSDLQIVDNYQRGAFPISETDISDYQQQKQESEASGIVDLDEDFDDVKGTFGDEARKITNQYIDYQSNPELWRRKNAELKSLAKRLCGVAKTIKVNKIDDVGLLKSLKQALGLARPRVFSDEHAI